MYCSKGSGIPFSQGNSIVHFVAQSKVNRYLSGIPSNYAITQFILTRMATIPINKDRDNMDFATI